MGLTDPGRMRIMPRGPAGPRGPRGPDGEDGRIQSLVAGENITIDETDPRNPVITAGEVSGGQVDSIVAGDNITVDNSDPANPVISSTGGGGGTGDGVVETITAGANIVVDDSDPANPIISAPSFDGVHGIVAGPNITVDATNPQQPVVTALVGTAIVEEIVAGANITVDNTDPAKPVVTSTGAVSDVEVDDIVAGGVPSDQSYLRGDGNWVNPFGEASSAGSIQFVMDNDGTDLDTGVALDIEIPFDISLKQVTIIGDQVGSVELDLLCDPFNDFPPTTSIVGSFPPELSSAQAYRDVELNGWTTDLSAGDILRVSVESVTDITRLTVSLGAVAVGGEITPPSESYEDMILATSGLVAYWSMNEASSPARDHTLNYPLDEAGSGTITYESPPLLFGGESGTSIAMSYSRYLTTPNAAVFNPTSDFTLECWVRTPTITTATQTVVGKAAGGGSSQRQYRLNITQNGEWRATVYASGGTAHVVGPTAHANTTVHLAMVVDNGNLYLWVSGTMYGPTAIVGTMNTTTGPLQVGMFNGLEPLEMTVDEMAFYGVALDEQTLLDHYTLGSTV